MSQLEEIAALMGSSHPTPRVVQADYFSPDHGLDAEQLAERQQIRQDMHILAAQIKAAHSLRLPVVYATLRREIRVVKIGFTRDLPRRLKELRDSRLLTITWGDHVYERQVHERLAPSRVRMNLPGRGHTEHFRITQDLIDWVNETRAGLGLDPLCLADIRILDGR